jgi:hypothetical protein
MDIEIGKEFWEMSLPAASGGVLNPKGGINNAERNWM